MIGRLGAEPERIVRHSLPIQDRCVRHGRARIGNVAEHRCITVLHRIGIVDGNIVDIHDVASVIGLVLVVVIVISGAVAVRNIKLNDIALMEIEALIGAQIDGQIVSCYGFTKPVLDAAPAVTSFPSRTSH